MDARLGVHARQAQWRHRMFIDSAGLDAEPRDYAIALGVLGQAWHVRRGAERIGTAATATEAVALMRCDIARRNRPWPGWM